MVPYEVLHIELNDEIIIARSAAEVLAVCDQRLTQFNPVNVLTAIHRIAKRPDVADARLGSGFVLLLEAYAQ